MRQKPTISERVWSMVFFLLAAVFLTWCLGHYILHGRGAIEIERERNNREQRERLHDGERSSGEF